MPPPKAKLHKNTGRLKNITSSHGDSSSAGNPTTVNNPSTHADRIRPNVRNDAPTSLNNSGDALATEQFELELCWCIQTLENSLASGKLNAKQGKKKGLFDREPNSVECSINSESLHLFKYYSLFILKLDRRLHI